MMDEESRVELDGDDGPLSDGKKARPELPPKQRAKDGKTIVIPWERLSPDALAGVIEEFVTREGTEHGRDDVPLETKVAQVKKQLAKGVVLVLFDAETQSVNLAHARDVDLSTDSEVELDPDS